MEHSYFFNSVNGDRRYSAEDFVEYFNKFFTNGVFANPSNNLQVTATTGMRVSLNSGHALIRGHLYYNSSPITINISNADGVLKRIDRIVVEYNYNQRTINYSLVKGTPSANPVAPVLVRNRDLFQLCLAEIKIEAGATTIYQSNIRDTRLDSSVCGIVVNAILELETTNYDAQLQDMIVRYNQFIQDAISQTLAGQLQTKISQVETKINDRLPQTITNKYISSSSFSSVSKQSWDIEGEYKFRAWVSHSSMTNKDVFLQGTTIVNNTSVGVFESATNGFYVYASEKPPNTVVISQAVYLKGD